MATKVVLPLELANCIQIRGFDISSMEYEERIRSVAKHGDADSQLALGSVYNDKLLVKKDLKQAVEWYRKAAEQNQAMN